MNVHIHRIREKLKKRALQHIPSQLYWGLGYKFERSR
ncbi:hypothetical protein ACVXZZ_10300 [Staphylococcus aureus]